MTHRERWPLAGHGLRRPAKPGRLPLDRGTDGPGRTGLQAGSVSNREHPGLNRRLAALRQDACRTCGVWTPAIAGELLPLHCAGGRQAQPGSAAGDGEGISRRESWGTLHRGIPS